MTRINLGRAVFGAAVAVALGVGAQGAMASPATAARPYCSSQADCQRICEMFDPGFDGIAICSSGNTCYCSY